MSTLTSTIRITGSIRGRRVDISHAYTIDDVAAAGVNSPDAPQAQASAYTGGDFYGSYARMPQFDVASPKYVMASNKSTSRLGRVNLANDAESIDVDLTLMPGAFAILCNSDSAGMFNIVNSSTATDLYDLDSITTGVSFTGASPVIEVFAAHNEAS